MTRGLKLWRNKESQKKRHLMSQRLSSNKRNRKFKRFSKRYPSLREE